ncbi:MAG: proline hydroxylase [Sphingomonadales bacterium]|nr:proline hydroxylase [Sphingomonadales bacterium]
MTKRVVVGKYIMMNTGFAIDPRHDPRLLAATFARTGRIRISNFLLRDAAEMLHDELAASAAWRRVINGKDKVFEISRADFASLDPGYRIQIQDRITAASLNGFQFTYETIRISDDMVERGKSKTALDAFLDFMNGVDVRQFFRDLTQATRVDLIDGQATAYGPGDFLSRHDDNVVGKRRLGAYVLGLTKNWQQQWGGALQFHAGAPETWTPAFNTLALFVVPQQHSVDHVSSDADRLRLSVTGWLRNRS